MLIHEAQAAHLVKLIQQGAEQIGNARAAKIMSDILRYHTTPLEAASEANQAGVQLLVLSHIGPPTSNLLSRIAFMRGVANIRPHGTVIGYDGLLLTLPTNSKAIESSTVH